MAPYASIALWLSIVHDSHVVIGEKAVKYPYSPFADRGRNRNASRIIHHAPIWYYATLSLVNIICGSFATAAVALLITDTFKQAGTAGQSLWQKRRHVLL